MEYHILYKNGDDLRQDQLCMQILFLMDRLLKNENLDLKFSPYHTLATSPDIGMVEMVLPSEPVASILSKHGNIQKYLQKHNGDPTAPYEISKECMDHYIKSCAGYCVFTYLLGVGACVYLWLPFQDQPFNCQQYSVVHLFHRCFSACRFLSGWFEKSDTRGTYCVFCVYCVSPKIRMWPLHCKLVLHCMQFQNCHQHALMPLCLDGATKTLKFRVIRVRLCVHSDCLLRVSCSHHVCSVFGKHISFS